MLAFRSERG
jgi:hypothetical protein